jgi:hypothetical protein
MTKVSARFHQLSKTKLGLSHGQHRVCPTFADVSSPAASVPWRLKFGCFSYLSVVMCLSLVLSVLSLFQMRRNCIHLAFEGALRVLLSLYSNLGFGFWCTIYNPYLGLLNRLLRQPSFSSPLIRQPSFSSLILIALTLPEVKNMKMKHQPNNLYR